MSIFSYRYYLILNKTPIMETFDLKTGIYNRNKNAKCIKRLPLK